MQRGQTKPVFILFYNGQHVVRLLKIGKDTSKSDLNVYKTYMIITAAHMKNVEIDKGDQYEMIVKYGQNGCF